LFFNQDLFLDIHFIGARKPMQKIDFILLDFLPPSFCLSRPAPGSMPVFFSKNRIKKIRDSTYLPVEAASYPQLPVMMP